MCRPSRPHSVDSFSEIKLVPSSSVACIRGLAPRYARLTFAFRPSMIGFGSLHIRSAAERSTIVTCKQRSQIFIEFSTNISINDLHIIIHRWIWPRAWLTWMDGRTDGRGSGSRRGRRRRARMDDVRRPAAGEGEGRGGGTARGLRRAAKPQPSVARLWLAKFETV